MCCCSLDYTVALLQGRVRTVQECLPSVTSLYPTDLKIYSHAHSLIFSIRPAVQLLPSDQLCSSFPATSCAQRPAVQLPPSDQLFLATSCAAHSQRPAVQLIPSDQLCLATSCAAFPATSCALRPAVPCDQLCSSFPNISILKGSNPS